jgi:hypothetical protein
MLYQKVSFNESIKLIVKTNEIKSEFFQNISSFNNYADYFMLFGSFSHFELGKGKILILSFFLKAIPIEIVEQRSMKNAQQ